MSRLLLTIAVAALLCSCSAKRQNDTKTASAPSGTQAGPTAPPAIYNGIQLRENGLHVQEAYLVDEKGDRLAEDNTIGINEKIFCELVVSGYSENDGKVRVGASEEIRAEDGALVLREDDLFESMGELKSSDAKYVRLMAMITALRKSYRYFDVSFRVWDKNSKAEVSGQYRFRLR